MAFNLAAYLMQNSAGVGVLGAVVGGSAAVAKNFKARRQGLIDRREAVVDSTKETVGAGIATGLSAVTAGIVGSGLVLSLGAAIVSATAAKYAWDRAMDKIDDLRRNKLGAPDLALDTAAIESDDIADPTLDAAVADLGEPDLDEPGVDDADPNIEGAAASADAKPDS